MKIAVFYHCLFVHPNENQIMDNAIRIVSEQMQCLTNSGLLAAADEFHVGINGDETSGIIAESILPRKAQLQFHGRNCFTENRTIMNLQKMMKARDDFAILYFHTKGVMHPPSTDYINNWRNCMMRNLVTNWTGCIERLQSGYDSVGCHWISNVVPNISCWGGNFWWISSKFLTMLPPIEQHPRIPLMGGIDAVACRYEAEAWIGEGTRLPNGWDWHPGSPFSCI